MRRFHAVLLATVALACAGVTVALGSSRPAGEPLVTTRSTPAGTVLVDRDGEPLYLTDDGGPDASGGRWHLVGPDGERILPRADR